MKKLLIIIAIMQLTVHINGQDIAEGKPNKYFVTLRAEYIMLFGGYDGESYFFTDEATIFVPELEPGLGPGIEIGIRTGSASFYMGYQFSSHNYSHQNDSSGRLLMHNYKLCGLSYYLFKTDHLRPYVAADISLGWMRIRNGAIGMGSYDGETGKSYFSSVILGLGAGIEWNLGEKVALKLEVLTEWYKLTNVKGITKKYWEVKAFSSFKLNASAGMCFYLGRS